MGTWRGHASSQASAVAGLATLAVALTMNPLVDGLAWFGLTAALVAAVALTGVAVRRVTRLVPVVLAAELCAVVVVATWAFVRPLAWAGLVPTTTSTAALVDLLGDGLEATRLYPAPLVPLPGVLVLVTGGLALVAVAVDVLAVSLRRPAMAGLPLLAVYCVPAALAPGGTAWFSFAVAATGYLLLVATDAGDRVRRWGRVLGPVRGAPMASAVRVAALVVALAVVLPGVVPGLDERLLTSGRGAGDGLGGGDEISIIDPILRLREDLTVPRDSTVLTYATTIERPEPLRIVTSDEFTGDQWRPRSVPIPRDQRPQGGLPEPPGLTDEIESSTEQTRIEVDGLAQTYLPLPYPATRVDIIGPWLYEADTLNVVGDGVTTQDTRYEVQHLSVQPTAEQLAAAGPAPADIVERYTALPDGLPDSIVETAVEVAGSASGYDQAVALQQWFRSDGGFTYSVDAPQSTSSDAVADFLVDRRGYCVQFSSAMAVMARALGIPARIAVGFLPGTRQAGGSQPSGRETWAVSRRDAHAWPELYFEGVGWVRFEPTPSQRVASPPSWAIPPSAPDTAPTDAPSANAPAPTGGSTLAPDGGVDDGAGSDAASRSWLSRVPWTALAWVALVLGAAAVPLVASWVVSLARWRRAGRGQPVAEVAWAELARRAGDVGVAWPMSSTPRQVAAALGVAVSGSDEATAAAGRLAAALELSRYARPVGGASEGDVAAAEVGRARSDVDTLVRAVHAAAARPQRLAARWWPASGVAALGSAVGSLAVAGERSAGALSGGVRR